MLRRGTRIYLWKMKIQRGCLKMRMNSQAKPSKMQGGSLRHYTWSTHNFPVTTKGEYKGRGILMLLLGGTSLRLGVTVGRGRGLDIVSTRRRNLGIIEIILNRQQLCFNDALLDLPPNEPQLYRVANHHGIKDGLHHLKDMGSMCKLHCHNMVELGAVGREMQREQVRTKG
ncbi:hypothetical protein Cgig2_013693 [Carnegiea gigantea]|uniref:Uncharacterized protein n=1 Tax=Carnegiea gigantea TaxID=171969 RepID=A0A9Q1KDB8_9CARY|nr:hypothetical protein Cgig2_013693 [Carnegiea gigantea]